MSRLLKQIRKRIDLDRYFRYMAENRWLAETNYTERIAALHRAFAVYLDNIDEAARVNDRLGGCTLQELVTLVSMRGTYEATCNSGADLFRSILESMRTGVPKEYQPRPWWKRLFRRKGLL